MSAQKLGISLLVFSIALSTMAQQRAKISIEIPKGPAPWSSLDINNQPATFQFAIVTDRTGGHRPGIFPDGIKKLNLLQPEFVMSVGDLIEGYTEDTAKLNWEWKQFRGFIDSLQMPFFYVPGNHDITNKVMQEKWMELFGKTYYHFVYKDVLFLCLNSEDNYRGAGKGTIDDEQYAYVKKVLQKNKNVKWTLLFMHQPLWNQKDTKRWADVEQLLQDRKHTVFVGHNHRYRKYDRNNGKYFILATTGGGSRLRGPNFGEFDHVVWVTMTDEGPILANLMLDGIWHEDVMTEELADIVLPLTYKFPVSITPSFIEQPDFTSTSAGVKITNSSDFEMKVGWNFQANKNLLIDTPTYYKKMDPNSVEEVELVIKGVDITEFDEIDELIMNVTVIVPLEGRPDIELKRTFNVRPLIRRKLVEAKNKIEVDGKLDEWDNMDYSLGTNAYMYADPFSHKGIKDANALFSVRYSEDYIFFAASVTDDDILVNEGGNPYYQDGLGIMIDGRPLAESSMNQGANMFRDWTAIAITPDESKTVYRPNQLPEGTKYSLVRTKNGYDVEAAIPISYMQEKQPTPWNTLRFNIVLIDYDQSGQHKARISWQPLWTEQDNFIGSGTFFKQNSSKDNLKDD